MSMVDLQLATTGLGYSIAQDVEPALKPLLDWFTDLIARNRDLIAARVGQAVQSFLAWMRGVNWAGIAQGVDGIFHSVGNVVDSLGGWKSAGEDAAIGIAALYALPVLTGLASLAGSIVRITTAIKDLRAVSATTAAADAAKGGAEAAAGGAAAGAGASRLGRVGRFVLNRAGSAAKGLVAGTRILGWGGLAYELGHPHALGTGDTLLHGQPLPNDIASAGRAAALKNGIDPDRFLALLQSESGGYDRTSAAGAIGPAQLMPDTASGLGVASSTNDPRYSWRSNLEAGARYYRQLRDQFQGNDEAAEAAYNAGPNRDSVRHFAETGDASQLPRETQGYVASIDAETAMNRRANDPAAEDAYRKLQIELEVNHTGAPSRGGPKINITGARVDGQRVTPKVARAMPSDNSRGY